MLVHLYASIFYVPVFYYYIFFYADKSRRGRLVNWVKKASFKKI